MRTRCETTNCGVKVTLNKDEIKSDRRECLVENFDIGCKLGRYIVYGLIRMDENDPGRWLILFDVEDSL